MRTNGSNGLSYTMIPKPPLSIFDAPEARQGLSYPRPGTGVMMQANAVGVGFSRRPGGQSFNHPWRPTLTGGGIWLQRGQITMADGSYEPTINDIPISGPPPAPPPTLDLDPSVPAGGTESWVCLQLNLAAITKANAILPAALEKDTLPTIVHALNPVSQQVALALCPLVLITWRSGQPFQAIEGCFFNLVYTRVVPGPGGGPVQHFFT